MCLNIKHGQKTKITRKWNLWFTMPWNKRVCSTKLNFPSDNDVLGTCGCGGPHTEVSKKQARRRYVTRSCMSFLEYWYISLRINLVSSLPLPVSHHKETNLINKMSSKFQFLFLFLQLWDPLTKDLTISTIH